MADAPRIQTPYENTTSPSGKIREPKTTVPTGTNLGKKSRGDLALEGLIGAK